MVWLYVDIVVCTFCFFICTFRTMKREPLLLTQQLAKQSKAAKSKQSPHQQETMEMERERVIAAYRSVAHPFLRSC